MGAITSLAIRLEELLTHLLGDGGPEARYEFACPPYWVDGRPGVLAVVLKDRKSGKVREPSHDEVEGPIRGLLQTHRNVILNQSPLGTVEIDGVAVGKSWEPEPQYAGWIALFFKTARGQTEKKETGGSEQGNVISVSFGPRG